MQRLGRAMVDVEVDAEPGEGILVDSVEAVDDRLGRRSLFAGAQGDRCTVFIRTADEGHVAPARTQVAHIDVRRQIGPGNLSDVKRTVRVRQGRGDEISGGFRHGFVELGKDRMRALANAEQGIHRFLPPGFVHSMPCRTSALGKTGSRIADLGLRPGDAIGLVCPARRITAEDLRPAIATIESWGWRVRLGESVGATDRQFGGDDATRARDLNAMMADPSIRAVMAARGGYGTARLLPALDAGPLRDDPKWLVGFSDLTALFGWAGREANLPALHGPMPLTFADSTPEALESLRSALAGAPIAIDTPDHAFNRAGRASAPIVGGNLSVLYSLRGTPWFPDTRGAILLLEDLDEYLYHVDRMLLNLRLGGILDELAGLIVGGLSDMNDNAIPFGRTAEEIVREHVDGFDYPLAFGWPAGHVADNRSLVVGAGAELDVRSSGASLRWTGA